MFFDSPLRQFTIRSRGYIGFVWRRAAVLLTIWLAALALQLIPTKAYADSEARLSSGYEIEPMKAIEIPTTNWSDFEKKVRGREEAHRYLGASYMISGTLVVLGASYGLEQSKDVFAKSIYSVSQSLGVAAIGYGYFLREVGDEDRRFMNIINNSTSLSEQQKNEILRNYGAARSRREAETKLIRIVTHGLLGILNVYNARRETDRGLQTALYAVGGINALMALSLSFE